MESTHGPERTFTQLDHARLTRLISPAAGRTPDVEAMEDALALGELVPSRQVAPDVVTMYSQVLVQQEGGVLRKVTLCYPGDADPAAGFVSVLSPFGAALLGLQVGQCARWKVPLGEERSARIAAMLFQPEASGDYVT